MNFTRWSARLPGTQRRTAAAQAAIRARAQSSAPADGSGRADDEQADATSGTTDGADPLPTAAVPGDPSHDTPPRDGDATQQAPPNDGDTVPHDGTHPGDEAASGGGADGAGSATPDAKGPTVPGARGRPRSETDRPLGVGPATAPGTAAAEAAGAATGVFESRGVKSRLLEGRSADTRSAENPGGGARGSDARSSGAARPRPPHQRDGIDPLPVQDLLGQVPALAAIVQGPEHRIAFVNDAYTTVFGPRPTGVAAREALPELVELGLLPLMDQVRRSGRPRTVKSRRAPAAQHGSTVSAARRGTTGPPRRTGHYYTFTCTPITLPDDSGVLIFAAEVTDQVEAVEKLRASERRQREAAVTLQRSLLPQELEQPDDLRVAATYLPGGTDAAVGGDWYDVITLGAGRTALVIGDVMGRGVRAAAVMGQLRTAVRAYARLDLPPHEVLQLLDGLAAEIDANQIATCVYAVHDPSEGRLSYASAGHVPVLVRDPDGTVRCATDHTGPPLGTGGWLHTSGSLPLPEGATAVLYTDGLIERRDADIDEGVAALEAAFAGATGSPDIVCDRLLRALGIAEDHDDDVALLVCQHPERTGADAELFHNAALDLLGGTEAAPRARAFASGVLASWRFPADLRDLAVLAASELVANSLQHGAAPMRLRLRRTDRRLIVEVTDGDDHLPRRRRAEPADESGRGISIVATIASAWGCRRTPGGGKSVWCEFALPKE